MRAFAEAWPDESFVQQPIAQMPWGHNLVLLQKLKSREDRLWYAAKAVEHGWSRNVLVMQIETRQRERSGRAITNFEQALQLVESLPERLQTALPTIEQIERELGDAH